MNNTELEEIKKRVPHRFENILIDSFKEDPDAPGSGEFSLCIQDKDPLNREIFTQKTNEEKPVIFSTVLVETMALGAILNTGHIPKGQFAFFAAISKFKKKGAFQIGETINGNCIKVSEKGGFHRYKATLETKSGAYCESQLMAFFTDNSQKEKQDKKETTQKVNEVPDFNSNKVITKPQYKDPALFLVDELKYINEEKTRVICQYRYPNDHPCIKGHFPGNPVMMGVMQWLMLEDTATVLLDTLNPDKDYELQCNAKILFPSGELICEIKGAVISLKPSAKNAPTDIISTQKVLFREMVRPGDLLLIDLEVVSIDEK